ncbi:hypothetical protein [Goodfellowiella coeruleoviolacea]|uniref:hypothetical protein n=1 Tax=Goodfellowiella coeruleoviolacea TaxID=334858 RepID=UPI0020A509AB|nr:hypothetical protein [Goodfellowiella coeruleoviolacea]
MPRDHHDDHHGWTGFLKWALGSRQRFRRFLIILLVVLATLVVIGCLWGPTVPLLGAGTVGVGQGVASWTNRLKKRQPPADHHHEAPDCDTDSS